MIWLVLVSTALAFGVGFALSWRRMRRQLQLRIDQQVEAEIRRQIQQRVLDELSQGRMQKPVARAARDASAAQQTNTETRQ